MRCSTIRSARNVFAIGSDRPTLWLLLVAGCTMLSLGCDEDNKSSAPLASGGGETASGATSSPERVEDARVSDGGPSVAADGSGAMELSFFDCTPITFGGGAPEITSPGDFNPTHLFNGWLIDCSRPTIVFGLSEGECVRDDACEGAVFGSDTVCLEPDAHRLTFHVEADAIDAGDVHFGDNDVSADSIDNGLSARYLRPMGMLSDPGLYGSCERSSGSLTVGRIDVASGGVIDATFDLMLSACDGVSRSLMTVNGHVQVVLAGGRSEACIGSR